MIRKKYLFLFIVIIIFLIKYNYNTILKKPILDLTSTVKVFYVNTMDSIKNDEIRFLNQEKTIENLKKEVEVLKRSAMLSSAFAGKLNSLLKDKSEIYSPKIGITRAISYVDLSDYYRVWLDFKGIQKDKIFGLLYQGYTAGIAIDNQGRAEGLLQGDEKCIFSVYIGKSKLPGVIFGDKNDMLIKYIPSWMKVKVGDEVYTSGLDDIFFEGIKVGKVIKVIKGESYTVAVVEPYAKVMVPGYFHIVTKS